MKKLFEKLKKKFMFMKKSTEEEVPETKQEGRIKVKVKAVGTKVKGLKTKKKKK